MTIVGFLGALDFKDLSSAILFFPMAVYFGLMVVPQRSKAIPIPDRYKSNQKTVKATIVSRPKIPLSVQTPQALDGDRRRFLKLIGSAGLALFLFAIFTKKAHGAFFGSVPGPGTVALKDSSGALVDPAVKQPTDGYKINQLDDSDPAYYGFVNKDGDWFIMKESSSGDYRYYKKKVGDGNFSTEWPNRGTLSPYDYFDAIF